MTGLTNHDALLKAAEAADLQIGAIRTAFGAPGDYGYESREGKALYELYKFQIELRASIRQASIQKVRDQNARENACPPGEHCHPVSDINDLDDVCRELGIQESSVTPAEAVRELNAEIERLRTPDAKKIITEFEDIFGKITATERHWLTRRICGEPTT
jgi:hypothetical protein